MSSEKKMNEKPTSAKKKTKRAKEKKPQYQAPLIVRFFRTVGSVILTTLLSFLLFFSVTGIICGIAATTYVVDYMEATTSVSIQELTTSYSTHIYVTNAEGEEEVVYTADNEIQRIPVEIEDVPQHVRNAFVYAEDERFYSHEGVDYKRTAASFANMLFNFWNTDQGGSTITQQLVKNLTGDNEKSPQRKIREIFRAMQLEKSYSKDEILITYLNYIGFGGAANGVELGANKYFGKSVGDLTIAEAACLAAIPQSPEINNPFAGEYEKAKNEVTNTLYYTDNFINTGREANRKRMEYILGQMYGNGAITYDEYQAALNEHLIFTDTEEYKQLHPELFEEEDGSEKTAAEKGTDTSWVIDEALREFAGFLMEERGYSMERALTVIRTGGYQIHTTVNSEMQAYVEDRFSSLDNLLWGMTNSARTFYRRDLDGDGQYTDEEGMNLECGFTAIDYSGNILCTVGKIGGHTDPLGISYASTEKQQPGSAIKPVTTYGYALENDFIAYATKVLDYPVYKFPDEKTGKEKLWPTNYSESNDVVAFSNAIITVELAIQKSYNTIPALLCKTYGLQNIFLFATDKLGLELDGKDDDGPAPLAVGGLTWGVTVEDLVNAYMVYGNGGYFSDAHIISRVEGSEGNICYSGGEDYAQVIGADTSYIMNKLLQNVVQNGTGARGKIVDNMGRRVPIAGKTGTSSDWFDKLFVGLNPDFVSGIWIGYPENKRIQNYSVLDASAIWKNVIGQWISNHYQGNDFPECEGIVAAHYCTDTGKIATAACPKSATMGYWKSTNAPYCDGRMNTLAPVPES